MKVELLSVTPEAETVIEQAGRTCYLSMEKAENGSYKKFIAMLIRNGHLSVLEHAYASFRITGGSRSFTHQMVRHRLCAFSQQSQRYVDEKNLEYVTPPSISQNAETEKVFSEFMEFSQKTYQKLQEMGLKKEDARFVLPNAVTSEIVVSANFREFRHIFKERCSKGAQWEIRAICTEMLKKLTMVAPSVFEDIEPYSHKPTPE